MSTNREKKYEKLLQKYNVPHKVRPYVLVWDGYKHFVCKACYEAAGKPCVCEDAYHTVAMDDKLDPVIEHLRSYHNLEV